jgi:hypothetical protein
MRLRRAHEFLIFHPAANGQDHFQTQRCEDFTMITDR